MRIGILGGTFNPIHKGHLKLAYQAKCKLKLDKIIFVPANIPPHKTHSYILSANERYKMVSLAVAGCPFFEVSRYEIKKGGTSYSVRTLAHFRKKFGALAKLFFLAGADSLAQFNTWKDIKKIVKLADFIVFSRSGFRFEQAEGIKIISMQALNISSTQIRRDIQEGVSVKKVLPKPVYDYINKKDFYRWQI